ncbi:MAG: DUF1080 domain-containing protein [Candidatus Marinimicrobia bacterium]|jgi:hypothetical protein|nr:DUF1080 domain-containing protein [Candidatus Neomarinimicrobiota bacterium]|tara:strand:+ start:984 stop:1634 length:651 start_codon:yes stop_codon:yes gene_type:complete
MKIISLLLIVLVGCSSNPEWNILFDGEKVNGLRGYKQSGFPNQDWTIVDGELKTIPGHGVDLISEDIYKDFELELEWKVPPGGNSGIFYFASEEGDYIWQSAPEMQILDDKTHTDGKATLTSAGSLYDLIASSESVVKSVGEFNKVRIRVKDYHVEHWLNGTKVVEYTYQSNHMKELISKSKFKTMPLFAKAKEGRIGLQGDHGEIWYRNIRIRKL